MEPQVSTYRDKAARRRGQVRFAWLTRTRALRERGGAIAAWAADIVQHAVDGRTEHAEAELHALQEVLVAGLCNCGESIHGRPHAAGCPKAAGAP